jgi:hypothetical protein
MIAHARSLNRNVAPMQRDPRTHDAVSAHTSTVEAGPGIPWATRVPDFHVAACECGDQFWGVPNELDQWRRHHRCQHPWPTPSDSPIAGAPHVGSHRCAHAHEVLIAIADRSALPVAPPPRHCTDRHHPHHPGRPHHPPLPSTHPSWSPCTHNQGHCQRNAFPSSLHHHPSDHRTPTPPSRHAAAPSAIFGSLWPLPVDRGVIFVTERTW